MMILTMLTVIPLHRKPVVVEHYTISQCLLYAVLHFASQSVMKSGSIGYG